jgi:glycerol-3-phosphate acyltransferase PlsY
MIELPMICLVALAAYLVGAVPSGYLIARWRGHDILHEGSGNIGATNVGRVLGWRYGLIVFVLDFAKGAVPVLLAGLLPQKEDELPNNTLLVVAGVSAFLGHLFPVYLRFRGGKGVATGAGVITVLVPAIALVVLLTWGVVVALTRYVSLASLTAAAVLFGLRLWWEPAPWDRANVVVTLFCAVGASLVFLRHHSNIRRLIQGTEHRLGKA